jgi:hypothetical protein
MTVFAIFTVGPKTSPSFLDRILVTVDDHSRRRSRAETHGEVVSFSIFIESPNRLIYPFGQLLYRFLIVRKNRKSEAERVWGGFRFDLL